MVNAFFRMSSTVIYTINSIKQSLSCLVIHTISLYTYYLTVLILLLKRTCIQYIDLADPAQLLITLNNSSNPLQPKSAPQTMILSQEYPYKPYNTRSKE